jgi:hypothetical protein
MFIIISLWFVTAFLASFMAKNKNRNPIAWFFIAFFLLGLFSLILLMLLPSKKGSVPEVALSSTSEPIIPSNDGFEEFDTKNKSESALRISTSKSLDWYLITADGVRKGPLGYQAFKLLVREQKNTRETFVWNTELEDWTELKRFVNTDILFDKDFD